MDRVILAIDCGTQSLRAILFSDSGRLLDLEAVTYKPYNSLNPGWAEQDPEIYWHSLCSACLALKDRSSQLFDAVVGVGITSQRGTMINVDTFGVPIRQAITWLDQRKASPAENRIPF